MGIKTVMITGDNQLTAAAIAAEAGVDDFLAEATPEDKLALIRSYQQQNSGVASARQHGLKMAKNEWITYLDSASWSPENLLYGKNGIAALTFCDVPIEPAK